MSSKIFTKDLFNIQDNRDRNYLRRGQHRDVGRQLDGRSREVLDPFVPHPRPFMAHPVLEENPVELQVGQVSAFPREMAMADHPVESIVDAGTPDGVWRIDGGTAGAIVRPAVAQGQHPRRGKGYPFRVDAGQGDERAKHGGEGDGVVPDELVLDLAVLHGITQPAAGTAPRVRR